MDVLKEIFDTLRFVSLLLAYAIVCVYSTACRLFACLLLCLADASFWPSVIFDGISLCKLFHFSLQLYP